MFLESNMFVPWNKHVSLWCIYPNNMACIEFERILAFLDEYSLKIIENIQQYWILYENSYQQMNIIHN